MGWLTNFKGGFVEGRKQEVTRTENKQLEEWSGDFPAPDQSRQDGPRIIRRKIYSPRVIIKQRGATFFFEDYHEISEWEE